MNGIAQGFNGQGRFYADRQIAPPEQPPIHQHPLLDHGNSQSLSNRASAALPQSMKVIQIFGLGYALQSAGEKTSEFLETAQHACNNVIEARKLLQMREHALIASEASNFRNVIDNAEQTVRHELMVIDPARIPPQADLEQLYRTRSSWIFRDRPDMDQILGRLLNADEKVYSVMQKLNVGPNVSANVEDDRSPMETMSNKSFSTSESSLTTAASYDGQQLLHWRRQKLANRSRNSIGGEHNLRPEAALPNNLQELPGDLYSPASHQQIPRSPRSNSQSSMSTSPLPSVAEIGTSSTSFPPQRTSNSHLFAIAELQGDSSTKASTQSEPRREVSVISSNTLKVGSTPTSPDLNIPGGHHADFFHPGTHRVKQPQEPPQAGVKTQQPEEEPKEAQQSQQSEIQPQLQAQTQTIEQVQEEEQQQQEEQPHNLSQSQIQSQSQSQPQEGEPHHRRPSVTVTGPAGQSELFLPQGPIPPRPVSDSGVTHRQADYFSSRLQRHPSEARPQVHHFSAQQASAPESPTSIRRKSVPYPTAESPSATTSPSSPPKPSSPSSLIPGVRQQSPIQRERTPSQPSSPQVQSPPYPIAANLGSSVTPSLSPSSPSQMPPFPTSQQTVPRPPPPTTSTSYQGTSPPPHHPMTRSSYPGPVAATTARPYQPVSRQSFPTPASTNSTTIQQSYSQASMPAPTGAPPIPRPYSQASIPTSNGPPLIPRPYSQASIPTPTGPPVMPRPLFQTSPPTHPSSPPPPPPSSAPGYYPQGSPLAAAAAAAPVPPQPQYPPPQPMPVSGLGPSMINPPASSPMYPHPSSQHSSPRPSSIPSQASPLSSPYLAPPGTSRPNPSNLPEPANLQPITTTTASTLPEPVPVPADDAVSIKSSSSTNMSAYPNSAGFESATSGPSTMPNAGPPAAGGRGGARRRAWLAHQASKTSVVNAPATTTPPTYGRPSGTY